jgi:hypothetical protein
MTNRQALAPQSRLPSLHRSWEEKPHKGRSKLPQIENAGRPAMVTTQPQVQLILISKIMNAG